MKAIRQSITISQEFDSAMVTRDGVLHVVFTQRDGLGRGRARTLILDASQSAFLDEAGAVFVLATEGDLTLGKTIIDAITAAVDRATDAGAATVPDAVLADGAEVVDVTIKAQP